MASEIPDFKDWHELKELSKEVHLSGKCFFRLNYYVKYEPPDKFLEGSSALFSGKEVFKIWINPDPSDKGVRGSIALLLEDGNWVVSLPFRKEADAYEFFNMTKDSKSSLIKINILTESGWKSRVIKVE